MSAVPVTDLKQWSYCPRVVYYHRVLPGAGQPTWKMREALEAQEMVERLETRRTLCQYGWEGATRQFGVPLADEKSGSQG